MSSLVAFDVNMILVFHARCRDAFTITVPRSGGCLHYDRPLKFVHAIIDGSYVAVEKMPDATELFTDIENFRVFDFLCFLVSFKIFTFQSRSNAEYRVPVTNYEENLLQDIANQVVQH
jgi:hypothetical protein